MDYQKSFCFSTKPALNLQLSISMKLGESKSQNVAPQGPRCPDFQPVVWVKLQTVDFCGCVGPDAPVSETLRCGKTPAVPASSPVVLLVVSWMLEPADGASCPGNTEHRAGVKFTEHLECR